MKNIITIIIGRRRQTICLCTSRSQYSQRVSTTAQIVTQRSQRTFKLPYTISLFPILLIIVRNLELWNLYAFSSSDTRTVSLGSQSFDQLRTVLFVGGTVLWSDTISSVTFLAKLVRKMSPSNRKFSYGRCIILNFLTILRPKKMHFARTLITALNKRTPPSFCDIWL
jgi:hypothetical protein